jgi:hypothetical protein
LFNHGCCSPGERSQSLRRAPVSAILGSLKQGFTFRPSGQLTDQLFELVGLFGHSLIKGTDLFHSAALSHGAAP